MRRNWLWALLTIACLLPAGNAAAEEWRIRLLPERGAVPEHVYSQIGTSLQVGGGVADFTDAELRDLTGVAGTWNARATVGTRSAIAGEIGYLGSASEIDALGMDTSAAMVRNGLEANLRLSLPIVNGPWMLAPYAFGGVGWTRYTLVNEGTNTSSVRGTDDVLSIPFGGGLSANFKQFVLDARYSFYPAFDDELLRTPTGSTDESARMHNWVVNLMIGYEI